MKKLALAAVALTAGVLLSSPSSAGFYKWTDENGEVHYSETKPEDREVKDVDVKTDPAGSGLVAMCASSKENRIEQNGRTYCCNAQCVKELQADGTQFSCATQACYSALIDAQSVRDKNNRSKAAPGSNSSYDYEAAKRKSDKATIDECNARREIYCDSGAESIRLRDKAEAERQKNEAQRRRQWEKNTRPGTPPPFGGY